MKYLLDANVLSEPTKSQASPSVGRWLELHADECVAEVVVMAEIWRGIDALPGGKRKEALEAWFAQVRKALPTLGWGMDAAIEWGAMVNRVKRAGFTVGITDAMIAATAKAHGLTVATRNVDDFVRCGVAVVNPFEQLHS